MKERKGKEENGMKKILILTILLSVLCIGCTNANSNQDETFDEVLRHLTEANTIKYTAVFSEACHYEDMTESFAEALAESQGDERIYSQSIVNGEVRRAPFSMSTLSISNSKQNLQSGTNFGKMCLGYSDQPFYREIYQAPIKDSEYDIDALNTITLTPDFEEYISSRIEQYRETPDLGLHQEGDDMYWAMQYDVMQLETDPFKLLLYLVQQNADSFKSDHTNAGIITYTGQIDPDTLAGYYMNAGSDAFEGLFFGYEGEMTREALMNEIIRNDYLAMLLPLNALFFSDQHMPVTISKNSADNTYGITVFMTEIQNALYESMYADSEFSYVVDEHIVEYTNMVLGE